MNITSIQKKERVADLVFTAIKNSLVNGELGAGDRLPAVNELADKMGVGVSSVREAIKMLETMGVVELRQGEGTFVCSELQGNAANALGIQFMLLPRSPEYLVQFREIYETAYTHLAMENATQEDLMQLELIMSALEEKLRSESPDTSTSAQDEMDFHMCVLNCTHNPYIITIGKSALELFFVVMNDRIGPLKLREAAIDHRNILNALKSKDTALLAKVFKRSFGSWKERFVAAGVAKNKSEGRD